MSLRNAFGELGLESTLRKILAAVTYARSPTDQLRVVVDSGAIVISGPANLNNWNSTLTMNGATSAYFAPNTFTGMDARETARESAELHFMMTRNRWTIT